jgi:ribonucleoside-triphosphate reductase
MMKQSACGEELMKIFETIAHGNEQDLMQENANVDGLSPMGMM